MLLSFLVLQHSRNPMNVSLSAPLMTDEMATMLKSVGMDTGAQGTVYQPLMQLLLSPAMPGEDSLQIWELTQKLYQNKDGEVELSEEEANILRNKVANINLPWMKARLLSVIG